MYSEEKEPLISDQHYFYFPIRRHRAHRLFLCVCVHIALLQHDGCHRYYICQVKISHHSEIANSALPPSTHTVTHTLQATAVVVSSILRASEYGSRHTVTDFKAKHYYKLVFLFVCFVCLLHVSTVLPPHCKNTLSSSPLYYTTNHSPSPWITDCWPRLNKLLMVMFLLDDCAQAGWWKNHMNIIWTLNNCILCSWLSAKS